jgi:inorganic pyrophosphatase
MSPALNELAPHAGADLYRVIVESPCGARVKYLYEPDLGTFRIKRALPAGSAYPFDWGFVPGTQAPDGDPIDAMVMGDQVSYPGTLIEVRLIAMLEVTQRDAVRTMPHHNPRVIGVPAWLEPEPYLAQLDPVRKDLCAFLVRVGEANGKTILDTRWLSADAARKYVEDHLSGS